MKGADSNPSVSSGARVFLYDSEMAPYKFPLYAELSKQWNLLVFFSRERGSSRVWTLNPHDYHFRFEILKRLPLGPFSVNPALPFRALGAFDVYIVAGAGVQYCFGMLISVLAGKARRKPVIFWTEGFEPGVEVPADYGLLHKLKRFLERSLYLRLLYRIPDYFLTHGSRPAEELVRVGVAPDKIVETISAVPDLDVGTLSLPDDIRSQFAGKRVILTAAYLTRRKGIDLLIRAFRRLPGEDLVLVIMGEGKERHNLEGLAKGDPRIYFAGYCEGQRKSAYFSVAEIFVLPTFYDPWGLVVNEAMQFGCAVVTTQSTGCVGKIVRDGENGLVVKPGDEDQLAEALGKLISNPQLSRRMRIKSREIIAENGVKAMARDFLHAVERFCFSRKPLFRADEGSDGDLRARNALTRGAHREGDSG